mmetsp:Transcript_15521/g.35756  ORF Transcript_15521/g.35756 Transcript_15521/m.35756 type:complete len:289 (+) Transcript_15521:727-1593(+)
MGDGGSALLAHLVAVEVELLDGFVVLEHLRERRRPHRANHVPSQVHRGHGTVHRQRLGKLLGTLGVDAVVPQAQRVQRGALLHIGRNLLCSAVPHLAVPEVYRTHTHPRCHVTQLQHLCTLGAGRVGQQLPLHLWLDMHSEGRDVEVARLGAGRMLVTVVELAQRREKDGRAAGEACIALLDACEGLCELLYQEGDRRPPVVMQLGEGLVNNGLRSLVRLHRGQDKDLEGADARELPLPVALLLQVGGAPQRLSSLHCLELLLLSEPLEQLDGRHIVYQGHIDGQRDV